MSKQMTFGVIVGNRGFFPDHLAQSGREEMIRVLESAGHGVVAVGAEETKYGARCRFFTLVYSLLNHKSRNNYE